MHFGSTKPIEDGISELCLSFFSHTHNSDGFLMLGLHSDRIQIIHKGLLRPEANVFRFSFSLSVAKT